MHEILETPIYERTFKINTFDGSNNKIVKTFSASNDHSNCVMQFHSHLLNLSNTNKVGIIIYKNCLNEKIVPEKYQYLTQGPVYKIEENDNTLKLFVSFHGCLFEIEFNKEHMLDESITSLTDKDFVMVGVSKL